MSPLLASSCWLSLLLSLLAAPAVRAQEEERMDVRVTLNAKEAKVGTTIQARVTLDIKKGFHSYPVKQRDPKAAGFVTTIEVKEEDDKKAPVEIAGDIQGPAPREKVEAELGTVGYYEGKVELIVPMKLKASTPAGKVKFALDINTQVCDEKGCLPYSKSFDLELLVKR